MFEGIILFICLLNYLSFTGFGVLTAVTRKNTFYWDLAPYSPIEFHRRFVRMYSKLVACFLLAIRLAYSPILNTVACRPVAR
jgi:hypothetical protein